MDMGFSSQKLLQTPNFFKNILSHDVGSLGACQEAEISVRNERREGVFIRKVRHQLPNKATDVRQP
jgi:hypothetical protein